MGERLAHRVERRLRAAVAVGEAEVPIVDVEAAAVPLVGPREHEGARAACLERGPDLPVEHLRLHFLAVPPAVQPDLGHHQGPVAGDVLEPRQVGRERPLRLQVDVEGHEVEERELEVLRRREVDVGDEALGVLLLGCAVEAVQEALDRAAAVPAHDRRGDLVADGVGHDGRVAGARPDPIADASLDRPGAFTLVEEGHVLLPREADHDHQAVPLGGVQKPARWHGVGAQRVQAVTGHLREVGLDHRGIRVVAAGIVRAERPVGRTLDEDLLLFPQEELAPDVRTR